MSFFKGAGRIQKVYTKMKSRFSKAPKVFSDFRGFVMSKRFACSFIVSSLLQQYILRDEDCGEHVGGRRNLLEVAADEVDENVGNHTEHDAV